MSSSTESSDSRDRDSMPQRASSPFDHHASFVPFPSSIIDDETSESSYPEPVKSGNQHLAETMGYRTHAILGGNVHRLRADAVTYIEKLTMGRPPSRRPQYLSEYDVRQILFFRIPEKYFLRCGWSKSQIQAQSWACDDAIAKAAAEYIIHLRSDASARKNRIAGYKRSVSKPRSNAKRPKQGLARQEVVETAMSKIETWCEDWLEGRIYEADWDGMEECL